jgi:hypothetical protein
MPLAFLDPVSAETLIWSVPPILISNASIATLGANKTTGIRLASGLAPGLCIVCWIEVKSTETGTMEQQLHVQGCSHDSTYFINNVPHTGTLLLPLKNADTLSLLCRNGKMLYSYRVRLEVDDETISTNNPLSRALPSPTKVSRTANDTTPHKATEECACSLCFEILIQSTTLVPCGHSFCKDCVATNVECPTVSVFGVEYAKGVRQTH